MKVVSGITFTVALLVAGQAVAGNAPTPKEAATCLACHDVEAKKIGPPYKDVAKKYAGQKNAQAELAERIVKGTAAPGLGWMKEGKATMLFMPPNATVTPEDAAKLAKWVLSMK